MLTPAETLLSGIQQQQTLERSQNPFLVFGQQMQRAPRPAYRGGGFWENFAAQAAPGLLGAVSSYIGQQQVSDRSRELAEQLLPILQMKDKSQQIGQLAAVNPDLAVQMQVANQAQEQERANKLWELKQTWEHGGGKAQLDSLNDYRAVQEEIGRGNLRVSQGNLAATKQANQIAAAAAAQEQMRDMFDKYVDMDADIEKSEPVKQWFKAKEYTSALKGLVEGYDPESDGGVFAEAAGKIFARVLSPEATNDSDREVIARAAGFGGQMANFSNWLLEKGQQDPSIYLQLIPVAQNIANAKRENMNNHILGRRQQLDQYKRLYPGFDPRKVGRTDNTPYSINVPDALAQAVANRRKTTLRATTQRPDNIEAYEQLQHPVTGAIKYVPKTNYRGMP